MREILFRGKRLDNGKWVEGAFCPKNSKGDIPCIIVYNGTMAGFWFEVDPSTVGQYTGLTDKDGKRIFEGDVVRGTDRGGRFPEVSGYVGHRDGSFVIFGDFMTHYRWLDYDVEVIGNIHDNPELLKGE